MSKLNKMKAAAVVMGIAMSGSAMATTQAEIDEKMIHIASRAMYMNDYCGIDIDKEKFFEIAKLAAFTEGMKIDEQQINWPSLVVPARQTYHEYRQANPNGETCGELQDRLAHVLPMLHSKPYTMM